MENDLRFSRKFKVILNSVSSMDYNQIFSYGVLQSRINYFNYKHRQRLHTLVNVYKMLRGS